MRRCQASLPIVVVLPVPLTPTTRITVGSGRRSIVVVAGAGELGEQLGQALGQRLAADELALLGLALELLDDLRGRARADVGVDQRLLEALPGLLVEVALEQRRLDLGLRAPRASCACSRAGGGRSRGAAPRARARAASARAPAAVGDEEVVPVARHGTRENRAMPDEITVRAEAADSLIAARLVRRDGHRDGPAATRSGPGRGVGSGASPSDFSPPTGAFLVIYAGGKPVAGGGVKRDEDGVAEIKRMYVVPAARRQGLARRLLAALEDAARELGYERMRLDTGARQPHAQAMYERAGYHPIENYNGNSMAELALSGRSVQAACASARRTVHGRVALQRSGGAVGAAA